jgi:hypothetical protein
VGANATLDRFFEDAKSDGALDVSLSGDKVTILGETAEEGSTTCDGVDDPQLLMAYWADPTDESALPEITTGDFRDKRLTENGAAITIYFGDADADIPKPPATANLAALGAADGGQVPPAEGSGTTTPADDTTVTTSAGDASTTSAP